MSARSIMTSAVVHSARARRLISSSNLLRTAGAWGLGTRIIPSAPGARGGPVSSTLAEVAARARGSG